MRIRFDGRQAPKARKRPLYRPSTRAWKLDKLLDAVRDHVSQQSDGSYFTVNEVATLLRAKPGLVHLCFHKLNLEGRLSQGHNSVPYDDIRRASRFDHTSSGWVDTFYRKRNPRE